MVTRRGYAEYLAGQFHTLAHSRTYRPASARRGCIWLPGGGGDDKAFVRPGPSGVDVAGVDLIRTITDAGFPVTGFPVVSLNTYFTWGNDTAQARVDALYDYAIASLGYPTEVLLVGGSMGMVTGSVWMKNNPTKVRAMAMTVPLTHMDSLHDDNRGGYATSIEDAYGGLGPYNTAVPNRDPIAIEASLTKPMRLWYSTDDTLVLASEVQAFATASGAEATSIGAAGGHSISTLDTDQVVEFLEEWE